MASLKLDPAAVPAALANRVLAREQWARDCLAAHSGRSFKVAVGPASATMRIDDSGSIESAHAPMSPTGRPEGEYRSAEHEGTPVSAPDLTLRVSPFALPAFLADPKRWDAFVTADGDAALATTLKGLAETLPWFVERAFADALGPIAGQFVADAGRRMLAFPGYAGERVGDSVASYVRDEVSLAATTAQARTFSDEIAETAARVDALVARVDALAAQLTTEPTKR